jgi:hypothetical protein
MSASRILIVLLCCLLVSAKLTSAATPVARNYDVFCSCGGTLQLVEFEKDVLPGKICRMTAECMKCHAILTWFCKGSLENIVQVKNYRVTPLSQAQAAKLSLVGKWTAVGGHLYFDADGEVRLTGPLSAVGVWHVPDRTRRQEIRIERLGPNSGLYRWEVKKGQLRLARLNPLNRRPIPSEESLHEPAK